MILKECIYKPAVFKVSKHFVLHGWQNSSFFNIFLKFQLAIEKVDIKVLYFEF